jgi:CheY-like chemotaxis protein
LLLTEEGYEVSLHSERITDITVVKKIMPDLVIIDQLFNSDKHGWELIQQMRLDPSTIAIPIILCTTEGKTVEQLQEQLDKVHVRVVLKPFDIDDLYNAVHESLKEYEMEGSVK